MNDNTKAAPQGVVSLIERYGDACYAKALHEHGDWIKSPKEPRVTADDVQAAKAALLSALAQTEQAAPRMGAAVTDAGSEPLPCPFCGGACDPEGWYGGDIGNGPQRGPECEDCGATAQSLEVWNRRASLAQQAGEDARDGWKLVPVEPTAAMWDQAENASLLAEMALTDGKEPAEAHDYPTQRVWNAVVCYRAMIAAAPAIDQAMKGGA